MTVDNVQPFYYLCAIRLNVAVLRATSDASDYMLITDIVKEEDANNGVIHLIRDRLFWRAWNMSAFLFTQHIQSYRVIHKMFKQVEREMSSIGFPDSSLPKIKEIVALKNFDMHVVSDDHIVIDGIPETEGYNEWKVTVLQGKLDLPKKMNVPPEGMYAKEAYLF